MHDANKFYKDVQSYFILMLHNQLITVLLSKHIVSEWENILNVFVKLVCIISVSLLDEKRVMLIIHTPSNYSF